MYHIFFIRSSVDRHLDCFYVLAFVNCAAMNIGVHFLFELKEFSLGTCPGVGLLDHMATLALWGTSMLFSTVAAPAYVPTSSVGEFPFLHTSSERRLSWQIQMEFCSCWMEYITWDKQESVHKASCPGEGHSCWPYTVEKCSCPVWVEKDNN